MTMRVPAYRFWRNTRGATAMELALLLPVFVVLIFGLINTSLMAGALSGMHYAVEEASRCYAVNKTVCSSVTTTRTYAQAKYVGPGAEPTFDVTTAGCGHTVTATTTYRLELALMVMNVPLSATACYPGVEA
jgi:Flp pilus assembly protein TadG